MIPEIEIVKATAQKLQKVLRVQDWDIQVEILNDKEMDSTCKRDYIPSGYCSRNRYFKNCTISLLKTMLDDWYETLVHEMVHVIQEDMSNWVDNRLIPSISDKAVSDAADKDFSFYNEQLCCYITRIIVSLLPLELIQNGS